MRKNALPLILAIILAAVVWKIEGITNYMVRLVSSKPVMTIDPPNNYSYNNDYIYVKKSQDFIPYSKQDIKDIFYSILDNGYETFTFYCPSEYTECLNDVSDISNNEAIMTDISNFVHPYNNFTNLRVESSSRGEVNVIITKMYSSDMIRTINDRVDKILKEVTTEDMDIHDKLLKIHDYIINFASYDKNDESDNSGNAVGALIEGKSKCAGYADAYAIILARLGIKNYKVASKEHVWNAVYMDDNWSQIDLTWDDPSVEEGAVVSETIRHKFYMIDTPTLHSYDTLEHDFNDQIYIEMRTLE